MASLPCLACKFAQTSETVSVRADVPALNMLAFAEIYGLERVKSALCASHGDHFRQYRNLAEGRARQFDDA